MPDLMPATLHDMLETRWSDIASKTIALAEDFPEEAFESRPASGMRTFAEQLRHVAFWNEYAGKTLRREAADGTANELAATDFPTKGTILPALQRSFDDVRDSFRGRNGSADASDVETLVAYVGHASEHYGQLVTYVRARGLVPPASR